MSSNETNLLIEVNESLKPTVIDSKNSFGNVMPTSNISSVVEVDKSKNASPQSFTLNSQIYHPSSSSKMVNISRSNTKSKKNRPVREHKNLSKMTTERNKSRDLKQNDLKSSKYSESRDLKSHDFKSNDSEYNKDSINSTSEKVYTLDGKVETLNIKPEVSPISNEPVENNIKKTTKHKESKNGKNKSKHKSKHPIKQNINKEPIVPAVYYYSIEATLPDEIFDLCDEILELMPENMIQEYKENFHIRVIYGPEIERDKNEVQDLNECNKLYPGYINKFRGDLPECTLKKLNIVKLFDMNILEIIVKSKGLTNMYKYLRNNVPQIKKYYDSHHKLLAKHKDYNMCYDTKPKSDWCCIKLAIINSSDGWNQVFENISKEFEKYKEKRFQTSAIMLFTPLNETSVQLW